MKRRILHSRWVSMVFRLVLGGIFFYAGAVKSQDPWGFAQAIYNYRILPGPLINLVALILPWVEMVVGGALILGVWMPGASLLVCGLLATFAFALFLNLARGIDVDCGCFSTASSGAGNTTWYLLRDLALLAMGLQLLLRYSGVGPGDRSLAETSHGEGRERHCE